MEPVDGLHTVKDCLTCNLRSEEFFCALPDSVLIRFQEIKSTSTVPARTVLFAEGSAPDGVYMLCHGRVELTVRSRNGEILSIRNSQPGEMLGLHACISGVPHDVTAETAELSQVNFVRRQDFLDFLREHGDACVQAAEQLSQRCHGAYSVVRSFEVSHTAAERVARLLLELEVHAAHNGAHSRQKNISMNHEQIAATIGISRELVSSVLQDFAQRGLATLEDKVLEIHNRIELEKLVAS